MQPSYSFSSVADFTISSMVCHDMESIPCHDYEVYFTDSILQYELTHDMSELSHAPVSSYSKSHTRDSGTCLTYDERSHIYSLFTINVLRNTNKAGIEARTTFAGESRYPQQASSRPVALAFIAKVR